MKELTKREHKDRHLELHAKLDELVADYISHTKKTPSDTNIMELINWSYKQTQGPDEL